MTRSFWASWIALTLLSFTLSVDAKSKRTPPKCELLTIEPCKNLGYNMTTMPNHLGHDTQWEAGQKIVEYKPLMSVGCSGLIRHFICSAFAPMCTEDVPYPVYACRSMCERSKRDCIDILKQFGYGWPEKFKCSGFPVYGHKSVCMTPGPKGKKNSGKKNGTKSKLPIFFTTTPKPGSIDNTKKKVNLGTTSSTEAAFKGLPFNTSRNPRRKSAKCVNIKKFVYVEQKDECAARCGANILFTSTNKKFAEVWLLIWSTICFVSTMVTVLTYLIDRTRFKYPERPIIYLAFCYNLYSAAYLIRLIAKPEEISCSADGGYLIIDGLNTAGCSIVFILLYFFGMASSLWWVILTLTWFLSAALKWSQEAIANKSAYFHAVAWVIPAIQTIVALSTRKVDADELTGLCYIGNQNVENLAGFVLAPLCVYLVIGTTFLLAGFISLFRIRSVLKDRDTNTRKLEKLMVRIGVFSVLYTLPATAVIACFVYEYSNMESWQSDVKRHCVNVATDECSITSRPKEEIYMVRHFMSLPCGGHYLWYVGMVIKNMPILANVLLQKLYSEIPEASTYKTATFAGTNVC
ncbi:frizzled-9-like [Dendronephthya gigantea]|uniref:frizzled-9-like n=1 Tax=Dendronephthya gigantea TaxID=151771 RepID=UPI00106CF682|nr:frizzled-9-like [Dendronephthya gigantea]